MLKRLLLNFLCILSSLAAFAGSGIYLRGEVNSWAASADWEFVEESDGVYTLSDKTISGEFKIADASWSSACNYGASTTHVYLEQPYSLLSGVNTNIKCDGNTYVCSKIILTIQNGTATLLLKDLESDGEVSSVYVMGDNNNWDYMDDTNALVQTDVAGVYKGQVSLVGGDGLCTWRIYARLGMGGVYGLASDAASSTLSGKLTRGNNGKIATEPGTYNVTFDMNTGEFKCEKIPSVATSMKIVPQNAILVPKNPENVKILSLNNSLIEYNNQPAMFNDMVTAMGKSASWTMHVNLGKPLSYHYNEGDGLRADGTPSAKMMVRTDAWSHIILQEQSGLPRTNIEAFRNSVKLWVEYIRENCPNPNAVIIIPINWAYSDDWDNFKANNARLIANTIEVAREFGAVVCPVASAYEAILDAEGTEAAGALYSDNRHPTFKASYLAACMEYSLIFNESASTIGFAPASVSVADAQSMRTYAAQIMDSYQQAINHHESRITYTVNLYDQFGMPMAIDGNVDWSVTGGGAMNAGVFTADGTLGDYTVGGKFGAFSDNTSLKVAEAITAIPEYPAIEINKELSGIAENFDGMGVEASASLPTGWRIDKQTGAPRVVGLFSVAKEKTEYSGGNNLASNAKNGIYNFGAGIAAEATDRAVGGISTGVDGGTRCINVYAHLHNTGTDRIEGLTLSYDVEKYRKGSNAAGFVVQLYSSTDGVQWKSMGDEFATSFPKDSGTAGYDVVPGDTKNVDGTMAGLAIEPDAHLYLAWNISVASGSAANAAQALAIDNVKLGFSHSGVEDAIAAGALSIDVSDNMIARIVGGTGLGRIEAYGINGCKLMSGERQIDLAHLSSGIYVLRATDAAGVSVRTKIVR